MSSSQIEWTKIDSKSETGHFYTKSGRVLYLKKVYAKNKKAQLKTIVLFHDLGSYHEGFEHFIQYARENFDGVGFILLDYFGHGFSSGTRGHIDNFKELAYEISEALGEIKKTKNEEWIAAGQGVGSLVLLHTLLELQKNDRPIFDKIILSHFLLKIDSKIISFYSNLKKLVEIRTVEDSLATLRPLTFYQVEYLTSDIQRQIKFLQDPLNLTKPTLQTILLVQNSLAEIGRLIREVKLPLLLLQGMSHYVDREELKNFKSNVKKDFLTQKLYPNLAHDLYNEKDSYLVFNDILSWI